MKKVNLTGKLSLNKETIANLNNDQMQSIKGGVCTGRKTGCTGPDAPCISDGCPTGGCIPTFNATCAC